MKQNLIFRYWNILQYHGLVKGSLRAWDQFFQVDFYDYLNSIETRHILSGNEFHIGMGRVEPAEVMHYQPVYTGAISKPLSYLVRNEPVVGASSLCFLDLGSGCGKALHVAQSKMQHSTLIGIDLNLKLLSIAKKNLRLNGDENRENGIYAEDKARKIYLIHQNINNVDYQSLLRQYDVVIVFNKNSFDKQTTKKTLDLIINATEGKNIFYLYNNPVFENLFDQFQSILVMTGWHKNWNSRLYKLR